jgi:hypothetical protein
MQSPERAVTPVAPRQGRWTRRSPKILLIIRNTALLQKLQVFFLKRLLAMMRFLPGDVTFHGVNLRRADSERAVPILPGKKRL